uniref:Uncharacterized protein n=1 Tax=Ananas comosus var. bracteatus TaxID=296719 RepID=A0A6V7NST2_ANACO|nr:unnamed protein product [Ananas comosus var. bracteatus]
MHSHRCGPSSSQHLPASTPAAIKGERPVSQETQAIPKHHKGISFEDLNQIAALSHLITYLLLNSMLIVSVSMDVGVHVGMAEDVEGEEDFEANIYIILIEHIV